MRQSDDLAVFVGDFPPHLQGVYTVDVTVLTCSDDRSRRHPNPRFHAAGTLYSANCALPVPEVAARLTNVVVTAAQPAGACVNATTAVAHTPSLIRHGQSAGAWVLRPGRSVPAGRDIDTRYQSPECVKNSDIKHKQFAPECQRSVADAYVFAANGVAEAHAQTQAYPKRHGGALPVYCFAGASHARDVAGAFAANVSNASIVTTHYLRATHIRALPNLIERLHSGVVSDWHTGAKVERCTNVIVHVGQWDLGEPEGRWTPHDTWRGHAGRTCRRLRDAIDNGTIDDAAVLTVNYIPMMASMLSCPPRDWRQPWVIDVYNEMLRTECTKHAVHVVDTEQVIGPIWDSAWDWCHFHGAGFTALAQVLFAMFASSGESTHKLRRATHQHRQVT